MPNGNDEVNDNSHDSNGQHISEFVLTDLAVAGRRRAGEQPKTNANSPSRVPFTVPRLDSVFTVNGHYLIFSAQAEDGRSLAEAWPKKRRSLAKA